jgi:pimeloyl-ACP methyl ester carboxylesterase
MSTQRNRPEACLAGIVVLMVFALVVGCNAVPVKQATCAGEISAVEETDAGEKSRLVFADRRDQGYTIVLPGIWGSQPVDYGIVQGLQDADVPSAVELYDWTAGVLRLIYNLRAIDHNRREAQKIAAKIVAYQDRYPGRPVYVVGYSGGGGVAVLALEALPPNRRVTKAVLLAPTLASDYDLRPALNRTTQGICNFYSPLDVPILMVLSTAFGTTEGRNTIAAGAIGFQPPADSSLAERRDFRRQVPQQAYDLSMLAEGHAGGHFGWSSRKFVARHVAPLLAAPPAPMPTDAVVRGQSY